MMIENLNIRPKKKCLKKVDILICIEYSMHIVVSGSNKAFFTLLIFQTCFMRVGLERSILKYFFQISKF